MKRNFFILLMVPFFGIAQVEKKLSTPEDCVSTFFEAFHAQDTVALKKLMHEEMTLATVKSSPADTILVLENVEDFYISIASIPEKMNFKEELNSMEVNTDGILAHVWTNYTFYLNDAVSHKGVNAFTLLKVGEQWKIIYLVDTRRQ